MKKRNNYKEPELLKLILFFEYILYVSNKIEQKKTNNAMKLKMKYLKVFEDFINKEDEIETIKSKKNKEVQDEDEIFLQDLPEDEPTEHDEEPPVDDAQKEKDDIIEEIKRYYRKNKRR